MKIKVDDIVKNAVLTSDLSKGDICEKLGKSRTWLANVLESDYMAVKYVVQIGRVLDVDFSESIPEISKVKTPVVAEESQAFYGENNNIKLRDNMINIQSKYITLLEDYVKLLNEFKALKK